MRVPWGIIQQVVRPAGRRLPSEPGLFPVTNHEAKYKPWTSPRSAGFIPAHRAEQGSLQLVRNTSRHSANHPFQFGNLLNVDYREFEGSATVDSDFAKCRGCDTVCRTKGARDMHRITCKMTILAAIKMLGLDGVCAMCDKKTGMRMWGVPLCGLNCQMAWRYYTPLAFKEARRLVIQQGKDNPHA